MFYDPVNNVCLFSYYNNLSTGGNDNFLMLTNYVYIILSCTICVKIQSITSNQIIIFTHSISNIYRSLSHTRYPKTTNAERGKTVVTTVCEYFVQISAKSLSVIYFFRTKSGKRRYSYIVVHGLNAYYHLCLLISCYSLDF